MGREEEGLSSNRPELVALRESLEAHLDHENLLYLTDIETTLQVINKWIGGEAKLNLVRTSDADVLKSTVIKLQKRVKTGVETLLIKMKTHRGDPLNEETDIRTEMGRMKEEKEKIWSVPIHQCGLTRSGKGQQLLDDTHRWCDRVSLLKECYESRKRERIHEDGSFRHHQKGTITTTYTSDWFFRGESTEGNWENG